MEKTKPAEEVSAHPGGSTGGKTGEHGDQQGKPVLSLPAFAVSAMGGGYKDCSEQIIFLEQPKVAAKQPLPGALIP